MNHGALPSHAKLTSELGGHMRTLIALITVVLTTLPAHAACNGSVEKQQIFSDAQKPDTFVVESFGDTCDHARLIIYLKSDSAGWHALEFGPLSEFATDTVTPQNLGAELKEIASRIEGPMMSRLETWPEIQKASTQPSGEPWRGTPLVQAEYERLYKSKPRYVFIPVAAPRAKLVVWDDHGKHPVDFVYYGD